MKSIALLASLTLAAGATSKCRIDEQNDIKTYHFSYEEPRDDLGTISAVYNLGINPSSSTVDGLGNTYSSIKVYIGLDEAFSQSLTLLNGTIRKVMHWGPLMRGVSAAVLDVRNASANGTIDKRAFLADNKTITFLDGGKPPVISFPPKLQPFMADFAERMLKALQQCTGNNTSISAAAHGLTIQQRALDRSQDPGHHSWTYSSSSCNSCKGWAMAGVVAAEVACVLSTCWWSFGAGCVACTATAVAAAAAAIEGCEWSVACCPITCGAGSFPLNPPSCCFGNEVCLDQNGHCCSQGRQACAGKACCSSGQSCISRGKQKGTCCPHSGVCGDACCPGDTDECVAGECCRPQDKCGNVCCNALNPDPSAPNFMLRHCVNRLKNLCCYDGEVEVGNSGVCCPRGQVLVNGICCSPGSTICGGDCCLGTCQNGRCSWSISDDECKRLGFVAGACQFHYPSRACGSCFQGCCEEYIHISSIL